MHFYNFNIKDYRAKTAHLSPVEHYIYRSLLDWYYLTERPFPCDITYIARKLLLSSDDEMQALQNVLDEFFVIKKLKATGDKTECYHHARCDTEIKNYKHSKQTTSQVQATASETTSEVQATTSQVQATASETTSEVQATTSQVQDTCKAGNSTNAKKSKLVQALKNQGIKASTRMSVGELQALFDTHCMQTTSQVQATASETTSTASPVSSRYNQEPLTNNQDINTHTNAREKIFEKIGDLMAWQAPPIEEMQSELIRSGINRTLSQAQYDTAIGDFKAYYEQQAQLGKPLNTDAIRKSKLRQWLAREKPQALPTNRMDELRALAMNAPVNEFGELPSQDLNFYQSIANGVSYEQPSNNQQH